MRIKKYKYLPGLILIIGIIYACRPVSKSEPEEILGLDLLEGTWYLNKEELYRRILFQDSTHLALDTHIDTMFFYTYSLEGDTLCLYDDYGELINHNIILKLDKDSLIFANLLDKVGIQRYSRSRDSSQVNDL